MKIFNIKVQKSYIISSILLLVIGCAVTASAWASLQADFTGRWKTNYGSLTLRQSADGSVSGQYNNGGTIGDINGSVSGNVLSGNWTENDGNGVVKFTLSDDGRSFKGRWSRHSGEGEPGGLWNGNKTR
jgi:MscS family membrane protein